ncbi:MAG: PAS domain-containing protein, partial [Bacteroidota bacterium]
MPDLITGIFPDISNAFDTVFNSITYPMFLFDLREKEILFANTGSKKVFGQEVQFNGKLTNEFYKAIESKSNFVKFDIKKEKLLFNFHSDPVSGRPHQYVIILSENFPSKGNLKTYKKFIDNSPNGIFAKNRRGQFTFCNNAFAEFYGKPKEIIVGNTDNILLDDGIVDEFKEQDLNVMDQQEPLFIPLVEVKDTDGVYRYFQTLKVPVIEANGECNEVLGFSSDITDRVHIEKSLEKSETLFRNLHDQSPIGIIMSKRKGFLNGNLEFKRLSGYSRAELNRLRMSEIVYKEDYNGIQPLVDRLNKGLISSLNFEVRFIRKDGSMFHANVHLGVMSVKDEKQFISFIEDITE